MQKIIEESPEWYVMIGNNIINSNLSPETKWNKLYSLVYLMDEKHSFKEYPNYREKGIVLSNIGKEAALNQLIQTGSKEFEDIYYKYLLFEARNYQVDSGLLYLEKNRILKERFYQPRRSVFLKHNIIGSLQDLMDDKLDIFALSVPPGCGKALSDDTPVLTTKGWKKHGDLLVGDMVYGLDGKAKKVLHVSSKSQEECLITFTNGEKIQCHKNHEWVLYDRNCHKERIVETRELEQKAIETGTPGKRGHRYIYQLPLRKPFEGKEKDLPVKPYTLGVWLGDGRNGNPDICGASDDIEVEIKAITKEGYKVSRQTTHKQTLVEYRGIKGLRKDLQKCGMCHSRKNVEKYIPDIYFTASMNQRLELLAGLLDTDGTLSNKKYVFSTTGKKLKDGFIQLVSTFGWRCSLTKREPEISSSGIIGRKPVYVISFNPTFYIPCKLERKQLHEFSKQRKIAVKSIERVKGKKGNCIQVEGGIYCVGITMIPTHNSTLEDFFLSLVGGWFPNDFNLSSAHSSILTRSLYDGVLEIINDPVEYTWHEIFPNVEIQGTNAKETTVNLERNGRFKTWTFRSIDGSLTGATRCNRFLTADDLVSGIEEALNKNRLDTLWTKVVNDLRSRRLEGCKEFYIATRWSVHDPIGKLQQLYSGNPRARFIAVPALDENGKSNFLFTVNGFSEKYFNDAKESMDEISYNCLYQQQPVEREGLLLPPDKLKRFFFDREDVPDGCTDEYTIIPDREADAIWAVCDTKDKGTDFESLPVAYQYGDKFFIPDVVFDDTTDYDILDRKTADILIKHNPHKIRFESNNVGNRVAHNIQKIISGKCRADIETRPTQANKETKILVNSDYISKHFYFLHPSQYKPKSDYGLFMANVTTYTTRAKVAHDDGPDSLAMMAEYVQNPLGGKATAMHNPFWGRR